MSVYVCVYLCLWHRSSQVDEPISMQFFLFQNQIWFLAMFG